MEGESEEKGEGETKEGKREKGLFGVKKGRVKGREEEGSVMAVKWNRKKERKIVGGNE